MPQLGLTLHHTALFALYELRRLWQTRSGLMTLAATAVIWCLILFYLILPATELVNSLLNMHTQIRVLGSNILQHLGNWPTPELTLYWLLSLFILPIFCIFFTANQLCNDRERGTLRFLSIRTSRLAMLLGRFAGQMLVQSSLILLSLLATLAILAWNAKGLSWVILESALVIWLNLLLILLPFTAFMSVFSVLAANTKLAITLAIVSLGVGSALLSWLTSAVPSLAFVHSYLLGAQVAKLTSVQGWQTLQFATLPLLQTLVLLLVAYGILKRRAL